MKRTTSQQILEIKRILRTPTIKPNSKNVQTGKPRR